MDVNITYSPSCCGVISMLTWVIVPTGGEGGDGRRGDWGRQGAQVRGGGGGPLTLKFDRVTRPFFLNGRATLSLSTWGKNNDITGDIL